MSLLSRVHPSPGIIKLLVVLLIGAAFLLGLWLGPSRAQAQPVPQDPMPMQVPKQDCGPKSVLL